MQNFCSVSSTQNSENSMKHEKLLFDTVQHLQNIFIENVHTNKI